MKILILFTALILTNIGLTQDCVIKGQIFLTDTIILSKMPRFKLEALSLSGKVYRKRSKRNGSFCFTKLDLSEIEEFRIYKNGYVRIKLTGITPPPDNTRKLKMDVIMSPLLTFDDSEYTGEKSNVLNFIFF